MIILKSPEQIEIMRKANRIAAELMIQLGEMITAGVTTRDLDRTAFEAITRAGAKPAFKGYRGFPGSLCVSVNEEVVHGIPSARRLEEGDIISVDCGVFLNGFYGDHARTFGVGVISKEAERLLQVTEQSLMLGIEQARPGQRLFDISAAVQAHAEAAGFGVVRDYVGHGIGKSLHEEPQIPNYGKAGTGVRLVPGMVLAIEPMINAGTHETRVLKDEWTVVTKDGSLSAHFEHSVAITENGPDILSVVR